MRQYDGKTLLSLIRLRGRGTASAVGGAFFAHCAFFQTCSFIINNKYVAKLIVKLYNITRKDIFSK